MDAQQMVVVLLSSALPALASLAATTPAHGRLLAPTPTDSHPTTTPAAAARTSTVPPEQVSFVTLPTTVVAASLALSKTPPRKRALRAPLVASLPQRWRWEHAVPAQQDNTLAPLEQLHVFHATMVPTPTKQGHRVAKLVP